MLSLFALRNVCRNKRRSLVATVTIAVGVAALFMIKSFNVGVMNMHRENFVHARYGHGQINTKGYLENVFEKPWNNWINFENEHQYDVFKKNLLNNQNIKNIFPRIEFFGLLSNGEKNIAGKGIGIDGSAEEPFFNRMNFIKGSALSDTDSGVVLGKGLARSLGVDIGERVTLLGQTIHGSINGLDLNVKGIFHVGTKDIDDRLFQIQIQDAQKLLDTTKIETFAVELDSYDSWESVNKDLSRRFEHLESTSFAVLDKVYYQNAVDWLESQYQIIRLIILSVVLLGIFNSASNSIFERKREFGILRANGESTFDLTKLITLEGLMLSFLGASTGILFVVLLEQTLLRNGILMPPGPGFNRQFIVHLDTQGSFAFVAFSLGVTSAIVATLISSFKINKMAIQDLLRS